MFRSNLAFVKQHICEYVRGILDVVQVRHSFKFSKDGRYEREEVSPVKREGFKSEKNVS